MISLPSTWWLFVLASCSTFLPRDTNFEAIILVDLLDETNPGYGGRDRNPPADQTQAPIRQNKTRDPSFCRWSGTGPAGLLEIIHGGCSSLRQIRAEVGFWRTGVEAAAWVGKYQLPLNSEDQDTTGLDAARLNVWVGWEGSKVEQGSSEVNEVADVWSNRVEQLDKVPTQVSPVCGEESLVHLQDLVKTLLVGADGYGQLLLPDSVGRANVLQHPVDEFPQPPRR